MAINSREEANKYYQVINGLVDDYIDKWKIRPSKLKTYLKPGSERFNKFLERNGLKDIKGAEKVLSDVIDDRYSMESDGVITFESFKLFESEEFKINSLKQTLYKGIEKAGLSHEKVIADYYDVGLGQIDPIDVDKHLFKSDNWENRDIKIIIYSKEEVEIIIDNMIEHFYTELKSKKVSLTDNISVTLSDLIKRDVFDDQMQNMFTEDFTIKIIGECLRFSFEGKSGDYFIWIDND
jgi:hypothetical protein